MVLAAVPAAAAAEVRQAVLDGVSRIFDISPESFDQKAPSAFGIFRWSIEKVKETPGLSLNDLIADLPEKPAEKQKVLQFLIEYHEKKKLYRKQVDLLLCALMRSPSWRSAGIDGTSETLSRKLVERIAAASVQPPSLGSASGSPSIVSSTGSVSDRSLEPFLFGRLRHSTGRSQAGSEAASTGSVTIPDNASTVLLQDHMLGRLRGSAARPQGGSPAAPTGRVREAEGQANSDSGALSPAFSSSFPPMSQFDEEELPMEQFRLLGKQVEALTIALKEMQSEQIFLKKSVDTLKTSGLIKMEAAIQEVLEGSHAHGKDHTSITDRLAYLEKTLHEMPKSDSQRDGASPSDNTKLVLLSRLECIEAAVGDCQAKQALEEGEKTKFALQLDRLSQDTSCTGELLNDLKDQILDVAGIEDRINNEIQHISENQLEMQMSINSDQLEMHRSINGEIQDRINNEVENISGNQLEMQRTINSEIQESFVIERASRESMRHEVQTEMRFLFDGIEKRVLTQEKIAGEQLTQFHQLDLQSRRRPVAETLDDRPDAQPSPSANASRERSPMAEAPTASFGLLPHGTPPRSIQLPRGTPPMPMRQGPFLEAPKAFIGQQPQRTPPSPQLSTRPAGEGSIAQDLTRIVQHRPDVATCSPPDVLLELRRRSPESGLRVAQQRSPLISAIDRPFSPPAIDRSSKGATILREIASVEGPRLTGQMSPQASSPQLSLVSFQNQHRDLATGNANSLRAPPPLVNISASDRGYQTNQLSEKAVGNSLAGMASTLGTCASRGNLIQDARFPVLGNSIGGSGAYTMMRGGTPQPPLK